MKSTDIAQSARLQVKKKKAQAIICLSVEDLKNILHEAITAFQAWTLLKKKSLQVEPELHL